MAMTLIDITKAQWGVLRECPNFPFDEVYGLNTPISDLQIKARETAREVTGAMLLATRESEELKQLTSGRLSEEYVPARQIIVLLSSIEGALSEAGIERYEGKPLPAAVLLTQGRIDNAVFNFGLYAALCQDNYNVGFDSRFDDIPNLVLEAPTRSGSWYSLADRTLVSADSILMGTEIEKSHMAHNLAKSFSYEAGHTLLTRRKDYLSRLAKGLQHEITHVSKENEQYPATKPKQTWSAWDE